MAFYRPHGVALAAALVLSAGGAAGQGIPVIDQTAILKHIESIAQLKSQLDALHQQIEQAQQLYGSLNKLTDMADVANVLNDPAIRKALPSDFAAIEGLLKGEGSGVFKDSAKQDLAVKFVQYILSPEGQSKLATSSCYWAMPSNAKAGEHLTDQQKTALRWDKQPEYLKNSQLYPVADADMDAAMQDVWTEMLQQ